MLRGARSATMASKPFQKAAASTPVPGSTLSSTKRKREVATCRPWMVVRSVMGEPRAKGDYKKQNSEARSADHDQTVLQMFAHINTLKS
ncbi:hypothetical protein D3C71_2104790 [compost metagenome]